MSRRPLLLSHRTNMGTQPENSIVGIEAAIAEGVDGIEVDVRATADGTPVLLHDAQLRRTTGNPRSLAEVSAAGLRRLALLDSSGTPTNESVPTLKAALQAVAGRCTLVIEVKEAGLHEQLAKLIRAAKASDWCWIWSFSFDAVEACRTTLPNVPASLLVAPDANPTAAIAKAVYAGAAGVSLHDSLATASTIALAHRRGLATYVWTVDNVHRVRALIADDIDAICSNVPARIATTLRR